MTKNQVNKWPAAPSQRSQRKVGASRSVLSVSFTGWTNHELVRQMTAPPPPPLIPRPNDDYRAASRHSPCLTVQKRLDRERRQRDCRKGYTAVIVVVLIDAVVVGLMAMRGSISVDTEAHR